MEERYIVTSITGFPITQSTDGQKARTEWYVLDTAYNHRIVQTFKHKWAERRARQCAAELNLAELIWERELA